MVDEEWTTWVVYVVHAEEQLSDRNAVSWQSSSWAVSKHSLLLVESMAPVTPCG
jgi:hypothetical protein